MGIYIESKRADFERKLQMLEKALSKKANCLITDQLECKKKGGLGWIILYLLKPFYTLLGRDVYSHIRAYRVAESLFAYCEKNKQFFVEHTRLLQFIKDKIIEPLDKRTRGKYHAKLTAILSRFQILTPPQPKPEIPLFFKTIAKQSWVWPDDLSLLGLSTEDQRQIDSALTVLHARKENFLKIVNKLQKNKYLLILNNSFKETLEFSLPVRLYFSNCSSSNRNFIFLFTKKIVGKGGERTVKLCFEVLKGDLFIRKRLKRDMEIKVLQHLKEHTSRGIVCISEICRTWDRFKNMKIRAIEPLYEGPFSMLLGTAPLAKENQKLLFLQDLLLGLHYLHKWVFSGLESVKKPCCFQKEAISIDKVKMFHSDLKPQNILVRKICGKEEWEAVISDFGYAGNIFILGGTTGYRPPEQVQLRLDIHSPSNLFQKEANKVCIMRHNLQYGQAMDIWSMGLVFLHILTGKGSARVRFIAPLPCLEECFLKSNSKHFKNGYSDSLVAKLTQKKINQNLIDLKNSYRLFSSSKSLDRQWDLLGTMLRVKPEERISAEKALKIFQNAQLTVK